jgi:hypothetical protein
MRIYTRKDIARLGINQYPIKEVATQSPPIDLDGSGLKKAIEKTTTADLNRIPAIMPKLKPIVFKYEN